MSDPHDDAAAAARLKALEDRIAKLKGPEKAKDHAEEHYSQANLAWRMVIELVAGLGIGFGVGLGLDTLFGTKPILMIVFVGLGFAAGVKTMMRSAAEIQKKQLADQAGNDEGERRGD